MDTKELILETAKKVFSEFGYDGARVDLIAKEAGVNKAGIYYHIGGKEKLYEAVLKKTFVNIFDQLIKGVEKMNTPEKKLRFYIQGFIKSIAEYPFLPPIMLREIATGGKNISETISYEFSKIIGCLARILEDGEKEGTFIKTSPVVVHFMIISTNAYLSLMDPKSLILNDEMDNFYNGDIDLFSGDNEKELEWLVMRAVLKKKE